MASPGSVVIQFLVDARKAARDAATFSKSIEDVGDASDVAARELDRVNFDEAARDAENMARRVKSATGDMGDAFHTGATTIGRETGRIRTNMSDTGKEAGAEFIENIAEGIGSGQANLSDVISGTLGGVTNLAATLAGPVGIAAAGAAAGIGLVFAAIKGESERAKAKIDDLRGALEGIGDLASKEAAEAIFQAWVADAQKTAGKVEKVRDVLKEAGVSAQDFRDALAGDPDAQQKVTDKLLDQQEALISQVATGERLTTEQGKYLENVKLVLGELGASDAAVGAIRREQEAINELTKGWKGHLEAAWKVTQKDWTVNAKEPSGAQLARNTGFRTSSTTVIVNNPKPERASASVAAGLRVTRPARGSGGAW
jgi:uncharacterized protein YukE